MSAHIVERASRSYVRQVSARSFLCDVIALWPLRGKIRMTSSASLRPFLCDVNALWPPRGALYACRFVFEGLFCMVFYNVFAPRLKLWSSLCLSCSASSAGVVLEASWGPSWGHLGVNLGLSWTSRGPIFVRRHRISSTSSLRLFVSLSFARPWAASC